MNIELFLIELKSFFNDLLISGINFIPILMIKKLKKYSELSKDYNLLTLNKLLTNFINNDKLRNKYFIDISIWLDIATLEYENFSI